MDTNCEMILHFGVNFVVIKPPNSHSALVEVAKDKFDLLYANFAYFDDDEDELELRDDQDYIRVLDFIDANELKEIDIYIEGDKRGKNKQSRKNSRKFSFENQDYQTYGGNGEEDDYAVNG